MLERDVYADAAAAASQPSGSPYGIDNFTETNKIAIVSVKVAFLQVADDNITETGHLSPAASLARSNHHHVGVVGGPPY
ncbi:hypothetical protein FHT40_006308 [Mycolicibacterium sp. BK556]|nr:hypothetical protein [Mycolicibacterium sp. BK556]MBB3636136.1 hypothetical protein [Mycolicibacterium sp. BK607]